MIGANATCDCTDTGFTGDACELDIDECESGDICGIGHCLFEKQFCLVVCF